MSPRGKAAITLSAVTILEGLAAELGADVLIRIRHDDKHRDAGERFRVSHAKDGVETVSVGETLGEAVEDYIAALTEG